jgi:hypothetical protein
MSRSPDLTADERSELEELLERLDRDSGRPASLNDLLSRWQAFVAEVERGYDDSIYEYTNDLSVRDRLDALVKEASPSLKAKLETAVAPTDQRFMDATDEAGRPLSEAGGELAQWWHRVPRRRLGELAADLKALGYLR